MREAAEHSDSRRQVGRVLPLVMPYLDPIGVVVAEEGHSKRTHCSQEPKVIGMPSYSSRISAVIMMPCIL